MGISKVTLDGVTQIDLTGDTVSAASIAYDRVAIGADGSVLTGIAQGDNEDAIIMGTVHGAYYNPTITLLARGTFRYDVDVKKVVLPNVTSIQYQAFAYCSALEEIDAPNVTTFPNEGTTATAYGNNNNSETFLNCTSLKRASFPKYVSNYNQQAVFQGCTALEEINVRNLTRFQSGSFFTNCASLKVIALPKLYHATASYCQLTGMNGCTKLEAVDGGKATSISANTFNGDAALNVLVLRRTSLVSLANVNAFTGTPFASGGTGGTIYIPQTLYDKIGTGTSDYSTATNWATICGYGTITWMPIEGSIYETKSVDGLDI